LGLAPTHVLGLKGRYSSAQGNALGWGPVELASESAWRSVYLPTNTVFTSV